MSEHDGGPAYPQHGWSSDPETIKRMQGREGVSARDYFATAATEDDIQAWIPETQGEANALCKEIGIPTKMPALRCWARYKHADAMLHERERKAS